jgi:hypothetical protein
MASSVSTPSFAAADSLVASINSLSRRKAELLLYMEEKLAAMGHIPALATPLIQPSPTSTPTAPSMLANALGRFHEFIIDAHLPSVFDAIVSHCNGED